MVTSVFFAKYPHSIGINAGFIVTKKRGGRYIWRLPCSVLCISLWHDSPQMQIISGICFTAQPENPEYVSHPHLS